MLDSGHTHQVKHRILRPSGCRYALSTSIGQTHSSCKASAGNPKRVHTTLLRAELLGIGMGDHAIWEFNEGQESPCSSSDLCKRGLSRRGYGTSLSMNCKYGLWFQGLWPALETPSAAPLLFLSPTVQWMQCHTSCKIQNPTWMKRKKRKKEKLRRQWKPLPTTMVTMVTMGGDLQSGSLADRLLTGLGQPQINP